MAYWCKAKISMKTEQELRDKKCVLFCLHSCIHVCPHVASHKLAYNLRMALIRTYHTGATTSGVASSLADCFCPAGMYGAAYKGEACQSCKIGTYSNQNVTECLACPKDTYSLPGGLYAPFPRLRHG
jgi:hypothetical protein